jgi:hypothetical protein
MVAVRIARETCPAMLTITSSPATESEAAQWAWQFGEA